MMRMRDGWTATAAVLVGVSALAGCGNERAAADRDVNYDPVKVAAKPAAAPGAPAAAGQAGFAEMPTPPAGALYTIYCQAYSGADHQEVARRIRDVLRANTALRKWYVVHGDQQSTLYYGFYRTIDRRSATDGAEGERALADLDAVRTLHDSRGVRLFSASLPVPIESADPAANPAWDITRSGGYWSLEIATFKDTADRKLRAVEAVTEARARNLPAFYYHGPRASSVCIGSWPKAAAIEIDTAMQNVDPNKPLIVTDRPLAESYKAGLGPDVQTAAPRVDPVDPSLQQAITAWPTHSVNGFTRMTVDASGAATDVPLERSFLFRIPAPAAGDDLLPTAAADPANTLAVPPDAALQPSDAPGAGQLRSLEAPH